MNFSREDIKNTMRSLGLVPLFTHDDPSDALHAVSAAYDAGVRVFEFTNRKSNSLEVFKHLHHHRNQFQDLMLGIGTVMDAETTKKFIDAGADFIISPIMKPEMAEVCHKHNKLWIPGCATMTEIVIAKQNGAEVIKIFPGSVLGPKFVAAILPVVPDLNLMITGGVEPTEENLSGWFTSGAMCVGMGSQLFKKEILEKKQWDVLKKNIEDILKIARKVRGS